MIYPIIILVLSIIVAALVIKSVKQQDVIKGYQQLVPYPELKQELDLVGAIKGKLEDIVSRQPNLRGLIDYSFSSSYNDRDMYPGTTKEAIVARDLLLTEVKSVVGYLGDIEKLSAVKKYSPET